MVTLFIWSSIVGKRLSVGTARIKRSSCMDNNPNPKSLPVFHGSTSSTSGLEEAGRTAPLTGSAQSFVGFI